jgi:hypothetical protein
MSLHLKPTMSKSHPTNQADNNGSPIWLPGDCCPSVLATGTLQPVCIGLFASVSGHIWAPSESVNAFLQFYFNAAKTRRNLGLRTSQVGPAWLMHPKLIACKCQICDCKASFVGLASLPSHDQDYKPRWYLRQAQGRRVGNRLLPLPTDW